MRVMLSGDLYETTGNGWADRGTWPARWIAPEADDMKCPVFCAYRLAFRLESSAVIRIHVSADERYKLFLDGKLLGRGPERGDAANWCFETYDLNISAGSHVLVAQVWSLGNNAPAPYAQMTVRHAFLLCAGGDAGKLLSTGIAKWEVNNLKGYSIRSPGHAWGTGARILSTAADFDWGFERGEGASWAPAAALRAAVTGAVANEQAPVWQLCPAVLPEMLDVVRQVGTVRHVHAVESDALIEVPVRAVDHIASEAPGWAALISGRGPVTIPPQTMRRVIVDLENYYCAYTELVTSGGRGARVRIQWTESLYTDVKQGKKGNRDEVEGKYLRGVGDAFDLDGTADRRFDSLWWHAGRYIEIFVRTGDQALTIDSLKLHETHFPFEFRSSFDCSDARLTGIMPIMKRVLEMCSHETYMDCPYYEQLMYVGDTRLEVLATYALTGDDRLPRKAVKLFDLSRQSSGLTTSRYPSRVRQVIPPFSLWWIGMVHDIAMWTDDPAFAAGRMSGVRSVINAFETWVNADGLLEKTPTWNYMDWTPAWAVGIPPDADSGTSGVINLLYVHILKLAAELEDLACEPELAARCRRLADRTAQACRRKFYDSGRGLFADDAARKHYSEHSQCLAVLGGVAGADILGRLEEQLFAAEDLSRTTIYFNHYYFETCRILGRMDKFHERMTLWFDLPARGLKTTVECPEPSRSDCHAWGAHPAFHYLATILGIRPGAAGFASVRIQPQLGPLTWARGSMPHPRGLISVDIRNESGRLSGTIDLPAGLGGVLIANGQTISLEPGVKGMRF